MAIVAFAARLEKPKLAIIADSVVAAGVGYLRGAKDIGALPVKRGMRA
jgi:hypothetical protein